MLVKWVNYLRARACFFVLTLSRPSVNNNTMTTFVSNGYVHRLAKMRARMIGTIRKLQIVYNTSLKMLHVTAPIMQRILHRMNTIRNMKSNVMNKNIVAAVI